MINKKRREKMMESEKKQENFPQNLEICRKGITFAPNN
jgi:hypothetical protein